MVYHQPSDPICIYGAGELGELAIDFCEAENIGIYAVVDQSPKRQFITSLKGNDYPILSIAEYLVRFGSTSLYIAIAKVSYNSIVKQLFGLGIKKVFPFYSLAKDSSAYPLSNGWIIDYHDNVSSIIDDTSRLLADKLSCDHYRSFVKWHMLYIEEYSDISTVNPSDRYVVPELLCFLDARHQYIIDVGSHHGQVLEKLRSRSIEFAYAYLFEPDSTNYQTLLRKLDHPNAVCYNTALSDRSMSSRFFSDCNYCSGLRENGNIVIQTETLDSYNLRCDFLKIHTEGSELSILKGAHNTILSQRPAIATSVYHNSDGFYKTIQWIATSCKNYNIYFRSHNFQGTGSFLYCIPS